MAKSLDTSLIINTRLRSQSTTDNNNTMEHEQFCLNLSSALKDKTTRACLSEVIKEALRSVEEDVRGILQQNQIYQNRLDEKDRQVAELTEKCTFLENKIDDMEQWQRRGSIRIQGLKDSQGESTEMLDRKIIELSELIEVDPPLELNEIEVAHRLPLPKALLQKLAQEEADAKGLPLGTLPGGKKTTNLIEMIPPDKLPPRNVIIKFASRRVKSRVMSARKQLRAKLTDKTKYPNPVFLQDDLTAFRAKLAYEGRKLKAKELVEDSWVWDSKVLIKDKQGRVKPITRLKDIAMYDPHYRSRDNT